LAWPLTRFYNDVIYTHLLPPQYYIVCDEAVECNEEVLVPFGGRNLGEWKDSFNYHLSSMRQCIERAFGILVQRWGILWRELTCAHSRWPLVVAVCAKLHNLCTDFRLNPPIATAVPVMPEDADDADLAMTFLNEYNVENDGPRPRNADGDSLRRLRITQYLKNQGLVRPPHCRHNTKA
jgi:hypothetical protein